MRSKILFMIFIILFIITNKFTQNEEKKIYQSEINIEKSTNFEVELYKKIGFRKAESSILWIKQGLEIGTHLENADSEQERAVKIKKIYENSKAIAYLDPYFIQNYYTSSTVLAFIKVYNAYRESIDILKLGIDNNPNETLLKKYMGAVLAKSKGDISEIIKVIEEILYEKYDDDMVIFLSKVYELKFKETGEMFFLGKAIQLWKMALLDGTQKSYGYAESKIKEYQNSGEIKN